LTLTGISDSLALFNQEDTMTRKHFEAIAEIITECREAYWTSPEAKYVADLALDNVTILLSSYFATENPNFDRAKFAQAAGLE
jgi:hypothetical protein